MVHQFTKKCKIAILMCALFLTGTFSLSADYYVSSTTGKGKVASKEKPARDMGNIIRRLLPGDTVHIAEGVYLGRGKNGADVIPVPVSIIGGYSVDFSSRDPWGAHKTILTGDVTSKNYKVSPRLQIDLKKYAYHPSGGVATPPIVIDGLIIDQGPQNRYKNGEKTCLVRKANPKTGENPTPDRGALVIGVSKTKDYKGTWDITVKNCVIMNSAPTQGALAVSGYKGSVIRIENNLVINNTGTGILAGSLWHGTEEAQAPKFTIVNNTVLFTEKYDAYVQSFSGNSFKCDSAVVATLEHNVFGFADRNGIQKQGTWPLLLKDNIIVGNVQSDYWETQGDAKVELEYLEDEAEYLHFDSTGNIAPKMSIPLSKEWSKLYAGRTLIDRNAVEADIKAQKTKLNALRGILGLPLQAADLKLDSPVWLPLLKVDDALKAGFKKYNGAYGCSKP